MKAKQKRPEIIRTARNHCKDTKKYRYTKSLAIKELEKLANENARMKYPIIPYLAPRIFRDDSANSLTKCIVEFLRLKGQAASRVNNYGRPIDTRKTFIDVIGNQRQIGTLRWIKGNGHNGISDIISCINGRMVAIEVKYNCDRQSPAQKEYQKAIQMAGGIYLLVRNFEDFYNWYNESFGCHEGRK